ncbi:MAG: hypothetical protein ACM3MG_03645 [Bacillota bacterium]
MKRSLINKTVLGALMVLSMALTACGKKDAGSAVRVAGRGGSVVTSATCSSGQMATGRIYDPSNSGSFESVVKIFVSATIAGSSFGTIDGSGSGTNGVFLTPSLQFDSAGNIVKTNSSILIKIVDSYVGMPSGDHTIQPYEIQFTNAYSGTIDKASRTFNVTFQDQYGYIQLSGSYDNSYASGTVNFQNYTSVDGSSTGSAYRMGTFYVPTCGLLK